jgi:hypothetical protein
MFIVQNLVLSLLARLAVELTCTFPFHLNFTEQWFVQCELLAVHFLLINLGLLLLDLTLEEGCVLRVNLLNLLMQSLLFSIVVLLIACPDIRLLICVRFESRLAPLFFLYLPRKKLPHFLLLLSCAVSLDLLLGSQTHLAVHFVPHQHLVLFSLFLSLVLYYCTTHFVHELLGSPFSR